MGESSIPLGNGRAAFAALFSLHASLLLTGCAANSYAAAPPPSGAGNPDSAGYETVSTSLTAPEIWRRLTAVAQAGDIRPADIQHIFGIAAASSHPDPRTRVLQSDRTPARGLPMFRYARLRCESGETFPPRELCDGRAPVIALWVVGPFGETAEGREQNCPRNTETSDQLRAAGLTRIEPNPSSSVPTDAELHSPSPDRFRRPGASISIDPPVWIGDGCVRWFHIIAQGRN